MGDFSPSSGYSIHTIRFILKCSHPEWLEERDAVSE